jgi:hypothetical protein
VKKAWNVQDVALPLGPPHGVPQAGIDIPSKTRRTRSKNNFLRNKANLVLLTVELNSKVVACAKPSCRCCIGMAEGMGASVHADLPMDKPGKRNHSPSFLISRRTRCRLIEIPSRCSGLRAAAFITGAGGRCAEGDR